MQQITIKSGLFDVTLSDKEVKDIYEEWQFLREAVLSLVNPQVYDKFDNDFSSETMKTYVREYFQKERGNNSIEYINEIFQ